MYHTYSVEKFIGCAKQGKWSAVQCRQDATVHQSRPKADPGSALDLFFFIFVSALGLIWVSTWGSLYALKCEADPLFTYHPLYIPNIGTYVEKFGHFSVAIYWLLLNLGLLSMSALDGSAWVSHCRP